MKIYSKVRLNEPVYAMATVYMKRNDNELLIQINPDPLHRGNQYFKVYNANSVFAAESMTRISFERPEYIKHTTYGKKDWILNAKEKAHLIQVLNSPSSMIPGCTNWQAAILLHNYECGLEFEETKKNLVSNHIHEKYLCYDLPMPNYQNL